jgi:hypothetical protein
MQRYIVIDLIKYVISDYISIPVLTIINNEWINKNRIKYSYESINGGMTAHSVNITYVDDVITKKILSDSNFDTKVEINYKNSKIHGCKKIICNGMVTEKNLFKNGNVISEWNINFNKQSQKMKKANKERMQNFENNINNCIIC